MSYTASRALAVKRVLPDHLVPHHPPPPHDRLSINLSRPTRHHPQIYRLRRRPLLSLWPCQPLPTHHPRPLHSRQIRHRIPRCMQNVDITSPIHGRGVLRGTSRVPRTVRDQYFERGGIRDGRAYNRCVVAWGES